jgi:hypothetical protein
MFTWGFVRSNFALLMVALSVVDGGLVVGGG